MTQNTSHNTDKKNSPSEINVWSCHEQTNKAATKFNRRRFPGGKDYCSKN